MASVRRRNVAIADAWAGEEASAEQSQYLSAEMASSSSSSFSSSWSLIRRDKAAQVHRARQG